jgi:D-serine deaminase-like pyridoxal phosphate-dependent protein
MQNPYIELLKQNKLSAPQVFVDLNKFDSNARQMAATVQSSGLSVRIATKSLRVPELIRRALASSPVYKGLMCYAAQEALFLAQQGFDNFLIAYPTTTPDDLVALKKLHEMKKEVYLIVDHVDHLKALDTVFKDSDRPFSVMLEIDLSLRVGSLVVGVRRSPLREAQDILRMISEIQKYKSLKFAGLMAYEAHVAGVGDKNPFKPVLSLLLGPLRRYSAKKISAKRKEIAQALSPLNLGAYIFNGGGTGSLSFNTSENKVLSELTAGSGFYCPHLFDYYSNLSLEPAAFFSLQVVRKPEEGWFTCLGGGFVASGEPGWDRIPKPFDSSLKLSGFEATGEVQTPVQSSSDLQIGDSVIFRHAKAGEVMERFNQVVLIENGSVTGSAKTYRGYGECYF